MHFHLPKPLHGWREFAGEVGVIVVAVLIALTAEEGLKEYNWHRAAAEGEAALRRDAAPMSAQYAEQMMVGPCILAQIDELRSKVLMGGELKVPVYESASGPEVIRTPSRDYTDDVWTSLIADGTVSHMNENRRQATTAYFSLLSEMRGGLPETEALEQRLAVLAQPISLDTQSRFKVLSDLSQLRGRIGLQNLEATQLLSSLRDLHRLPPPIDIDRLVVASKQGGTAAVCNEHGWPLANWRSAMAAEPVRILPED